VLIHLEAVSSIEGASSPATLAGRNVGDGACGAGVGYELEDGVDMPTSSCGGNKKSLFIGCNYTGSSHALQGCINDVNNIKAYVVAKFNFAADDAHMKTLSDDQQGELSPTKDNIIAAMKWLIADAKDGDSLFFHYSGHGGEA
jgi:hypothetical protein